MSASDTVKAFTDAAADAVAREIVGLRREAERERDVRAAEHSARLAQLDARLQSAADIERRLAERLAALRDGDPGQDGKDGKDGEPGANGVDGKDGIDGQPGRDGVDGKDGKDGEPGANGVDGKDGIDGQPGRDGVDGKDGIDGDPGRDGLDVSEIEVRQDASRLELAFTVGDATSLFEVELPSGPAGNDGRDGEPGKEGPRGKLTAATSWVDAVHYEGDVRTHGGATWQAARDTAKEPPHPDWICIAACGEHGKDGLSLNPRRLWAATEEYCRLDVVALNGGSFVALKDGPGECPGPGWMLLTQQGKRGERGEKGPKGDRGERGLPAPPVTALVVNDEGLLTLTNGDGSQVQCDLYPLLIKVSKH